MLVLDVFVVLCFDLDGICTFVPILLLRFTEVDLSVMRSMMQTLISAVISVLCTDSADLAVSERTTWCLLGRRQGFAASVFQLMQCKIHGDISDNGSMGMIFTFLYLYQIKP